jgi:hypothetical protein
MRLHGYLAHMGLSLTPKRGCRHWLGGLVVSIAIGFGWVVYRNYTAFRPVDQRIAAIQGRGEPILLADFERPPVPDEQNAAFFLQRAAEAASDIYGNAQRDTALTDFLVRPPTASPELLASVQAIIRGQPGIEEDVRRATGCPHLVWGVQHPRTPGQDDPASLRYPPQFHTARFLTPLLAAAAWVEHFQQNDTGALERLRLGLWLSSTVDQEGGVSARLLAIASEAMVDEQLRNVARSLRLRSSDPAADPLAGECRALITYLLDEPAWRAGALRSLRTERAVVVGWFQAAGETSFWARPSLARGAVKWLDGCESVLAAATCRDYPGANTVLAALPRATSPAGRAASEQPMEGLLQIMPQFIGKEFCILAERRCAAVALALALYAADHNGDLPASLRTLVPDYLPAVPADPFTTGRPLGYRAEPETILWSVGDDGRYDGTVAPTRLGGYANPWVDPDAVFPVPAPRRP